MIPKELASIIKANPGSHLHYWDSGSWDLLERKPEDDEDHGRIKILATGQDWDTDGYLPFIVEVLCEVAGITCNSI